MTFKDKVEVFSPDHAGHYAQSDDSPSLKSQQKQKWKVLIGTFLMVAIIGLIWVWARPAIYQSQAILHFSYTQQISGEQVGVPQEQISLNSRRLTSNRVLDALRVRLEQQVGIQFSTEQLAQMLSTEMQLESRIINLYASGQNPNVLKPIVENWIALYLGELAQETEQTTQEELTSGEQKLSQLEEKIILQRAILDDFATSNNIVSLERDENRALSQIKSLSQAIDTAQEQKKEAQVELQNAQKAMSQGMPLSNPDDQQLLAEMRGQISGIEKRLADYALQYTDEYMRLDPAIVNQRRILERLRQEYQQAKESSEQGYVVALQRNLETLTARQNQMEAELIEVQKVAQAFNQKLGNYQQLNQELTQLEDQALILRAQLVEKEVQQPFKAKINVLEAPFNPTFPIAPNYWWDSLLVLGLAVACSAIALLLYSFIMRQKNPPAVVNSYTLVPSANGTTNTPHEALSSPQDQDRLAHQQQPAKLAYQTTPATNSNHSSQHFRLLSQDECQSLFRVANREGKKILGLLFSGVSVAELLALTEDCVDFASVKLHVPGQYQRTLSLDSGIIELFNHPSGQENPAPPLIFAELTIADLELMLVNMAHDAQLSYPDQLSTEVVRHTYLTFLVSQGARLNDIEQIAGYVSPGQLSVYRQVQRRGEPVDINQVSTIYPLV